MNQPVTLIVAVAALLPLSAAVAADNDKMHKQDGKRSSQEFKNLDTDKDGRVSRAEAAADATVVWTAADTDGDGFIDTEEWAVIPASDSKQK